MGKTQMEEAKLQDKKRSRTPRSGSLPELCDNYRRAGKMKFTVKERDHFASETASLGFFGITMTRFAQ
jgi:hypothetical protein